jgi:hypothetical protein
MMARIAALAAAAAIAAAAGYQSLPHPAAPAVGSDQVGTIGSGLPRGFPLAAKTDGPPWAAPCPGRRDPDASQCNPPRLRTITVAKRLRGANSALIRLPVTDLASR